MKPVGLSDLDGFRHELASADTSPERAQEIRDMLKAELDRGEVAAGRNQAFDRPLMSAIRGIFAEDAQRREGAIADRAAEVLIRADLAREERRKARLERWSALPGTVRAAHLMGDERFVRFALLAMDETTADPRRAPYTFEPD